MPSRTGKNLAKEANAVAMANAAASSLSTTESEAEDDAVTSGDSNNEEEHDSDSDSDSLDSTAPRKRRRVSPQLEEEGDDDDEEDIPKAPVSFISAPSRIKRKTTSAEKPTRPESTDEATTQQPDPFGGATTAPTDPNTTFESLGVHPWLVRSLNNMAIRRPTGIQKGCIPEILKGSDCIGGSRTGSGKTVAFAVPILQKWAEDPSAIFAVVMTPTR